MRKHGGKEAENVESASDMTNKSTEYGLEMHKAKNKHMHARPHDMHNSHDVRRFDSSSTTRRKASTPIHSQGHKKPKQKKEKVDRGVGPQGSSIATRRALESPPSGVRTCAQGVTPEFWLTDRRPARIQTARRLCLPRRADDAHPVVVVRDGWAEGGGAAFRKLNLGVWRCGEFPSVRGGLRLV